MIVLVHIFVVVVKHSALVVMGHLRSRHWSGHGDVRGKVCGFRRIFFGWLASEALVVAAMAEPASKAFIISRKQHRLSRKHKCRS